MHAPKWLFRVVTSENGCYTENVSLFSLMQFFILKLQQLAVYQKIWVRIVNSKKVIARVIVWLLVA